MGSSCHEMRFSSFIGLGGGSIEGEEAVNFRRITTMLDKSLADPAHSSGQGTNSRGFDALTDMD